MLKQYYEFENMLSSCNDDDITDEQQKSKWIIRIQFDAETLPDKNITMDDINFAISNSYYGNELNVFIVTEYERSGI